MTWQCARPEAEAIAAEIHAAPGWRVVGIGTLWDGSSAVDALDPAGDPRLLHSMAAWHWYRWRIPPAVFGTPAPPAGRSRHAVTHRLTRERQMALFGEEGTR